MAPEYRTPLPALLAAALEAACNRLLALDPGAGEGIRRLQGKLLQVDLEGLGISLFLDFDFGSVLVAVDSGGREADTRVSGTPVDLFALAAPEELGDWGLPGSGVRIEGDAALARDIGKLFNALDLDWQEALANLLGDTLGYQVASGLQQGAAALRQAAASAADIAARYFREEPGWLATREEVKVFGQAVDELGEAVERLQARLDELQEADE